MTYNEEFEVKRELLVSIIIKMTYLEKNRNREKPDEIPIACIFINIVFPAQKEQISRA